MVSLFFQTRFGPQFKFVKGVEIVMGDIESLYTYPHYWKSFLVPHLLIGKIDSTFQIAQGWTCHQSEFCHSELGGSTNGEHSFLLLKPPAMLIHPCPYAEIPKQPWNPILASVNPVTSVVTKIQPAQPKKPEVRVYGSKAEVWPYGLLPAGYMGKKCGYLVFIIPHHGASGNLP